MGNVENSAREQHPLSSSPSAHSASFRRDEIPGVQTERIPRTRPARSGYDPRSRLDFPDSRDNKVRSHRDHTPPMRSDEFYADLSASTMPGYSNIDSRVHHPPPPPARSATAYADYHHSQGYPSGRDIEREASPIARAVLEKLSGWLPFGLDFAHHSGHLRSIGLGRRAHSVSVTDHYYHSSRDGSGGDGDTRPRRRPAYDSRGYEDRTRGMRHYSQIQRPRLHKNERIRDELDYEDRGRGGYYGSRDGFSYPAAYVRENERLAGDYDVPHTEVRPPKIARRRDTVVDSSRNAPYDCDDSTYYYPPIRRKLHRVPPPPQVAAAEIRARTQRMPRVKRKRRRRSSSVDTWNRDHSSSGNNMSNGSSSTPTHPSRSSSMVVSPVRSAEKRRRTLHGRSAAAPSFYEHDQRARSVDLFTLLNGPDPSSEPINGFKQRKKDDDDEHQFDDDESAFKNNIGEMDHQNGVFADVSHDWMENGWMNGPRKRTKTSKPLSKKKPQSPLQKKQHPQWDVPLEIPPVQSFVNRSDLQLSPIPPKADRRQPLTQSTGSKIGRRRRIPVSKKMKSKGQSDGFPSTSSVIDFSSMASANKPDVSADNLFAFYEPEKRDTDGSNDASEHLLRSAGPSPMSHGLPFKTRRRFADFGRNSAKSELRERRQALFEEERRNNRSAMIKLRRSNFHRKDEAGFIPQVTPMKPTALSARFEAEKNREDEQKHCQSEQVFTKCSPSFHSGRKKNCRDNSDPCSANKTRRRSSEISTRVLIDSSDDETEEKKEKGDSENESGMMIGDKNNLNITDISMKSRNDNESDDSAFSGDFTVKSEFPSFDPTSVNPGFNVDPNPNLFSSIPPINSSNVSPMQESKEDDQSSKDEKNNEEDSAPNETESNNIQQKNEESTEQTAEQSGDANHPSGDANHSAHDASHADPAAGAGASSSSSSASSSSFIFSTPIPSVSNAKRYTRVGSVKTTESRMDSNRKSNANDSSALDLDIEQRSAARLRELSAEKHRDRANKCERARIRDETVLPMIRRRVRNITNDPLAVLLEFCPKVRLPQSRALITKNVAEKAFKRGLATFHPDRFVHHSLDEQVQSEEVFKLLMAAKEDYFDISL